MKPNSRFQPADTSITGINALSAPWAKGTLMHMIFTIFIWLAAPASSHAEAGGPAVQALQSVSAELKTADLRAPGVPEFVATERGTLVWNYSGRQIYEDGGRQFEYLGRKYSVKLGFERGEYDSYIKNYKAVPGVIVSDITGSSYTVWKIVKLSEIKNSDQGLVAGGAALFKVGYYNGTIYLRTPTWANIASFSYPSLRTAWEENAKMYLRYVRENAAYFVPQSYWDPGAGRLRYGYVVSEYAPYYPDSGLPLDYVELFTGGETSEYKPMAYCIPLGLTFKRKGEVYIPFVPEFKGSWDVKDLIPDDLQDALADELKDIKIALPALAGNESYGRLAK